MGRRFAQFMGFVDAFPLSEMAVLDGTMPLKTGTRRGTALRTFLKRSAIAHGLLGQELKSLCDYIFSDLRHFLERSTFSAAIVITDTSQYSRRALDKVLRSAAGTRSRLRNSRSKQTKQISKGEVDYAN
jgi:hypothetical protein